MILVSISISLRSQTPDKGTLEIQFTGVHNDVGLIAIGIYKSSDRWPDNANIELQWKKENIVDGVFTVQVPDLPYGTMAISALDDENCDIKMDYFLGIPREGYGFSMNPHIRLSVPKFDACAFLLNQPFKQITIDLKYTGKGK